MKVSLSRFFIFTLITVSSVSILISFAPVHQNEIARSLLKETRDDIIKKCESIGFNVRKSKVQVFDGFIFFDEEEILEIRLNELYDIVDYFIIVEGNRNFRGISKPLLFNKLQYDERFHKFRNKVKYIICDLDEFGDVTTETLQQEELYNKTTEAYQTVWKREAKSRHCILNGFDTLNPSDIILVSDVDEIPKREAINFLKNCDIPSKAVLRMPRYLYQFNWEDFRRSPHYGTVAFQKKALQVNETYTLDNVRGDRMQYHVIEGSGWHYSNFNFGKDRLRSKLKNFSHQEHSRPEKIEEIIYRAKNADQNKKGRVRILSEAEAFCNIPSFLFHNLNLFNETGLPPVAPFSTQQRACQTFIGEVMRNNSQLPSWHALEMMWSL